MSEREDTRRASILPLKLEEVSYDVRGRRLVDGVSFALGAGPPTLILGPNGAGKSLLLRLAHGLIAPTQGKVEWCGPARGRARQRQAMVFEQSVLLRRSAAANIEYALRTRGLRGAAARARVALVLAKTGLSEVGRSPARVLSAGEQQRLALARAWALEPEVLFLDEPTAALDPAAVRRVEELIASIARSGTKILMTTHDLLQARRLADEVLFMHRGVVLEQTRAEHFFDKPSSVEGRAFLEGELLW